MKRTQKQSQVKQHAITAAIAALTFIIGVYSNMHVELNINVTTAAAETETAKIISTMPPIKPTRN